MGFVVVLWSNILSDRITGRKNELVKCSVEAVEDQGRDRSSDFWQGSEA